MAKVFIHCKEANRAQQHMVGQCNINEIMHNVLRTRQIPETENNAMAIFADVSEAGDFQHLQETVRKGEELFQTMPGKIRDRFKNNAGRFLDFVADPGNKEELIKMGLAKKVIKPELAERAEKKEKKEEVPLVPKMSITELRAALAIAEAEEKVKVAQ